MKLRKFLAGSAGVIAVLTAHAAQAITAVPCTSAEMVAAGSQATSSSTTNVTTLTTSAAAGDILCAANVTTTNVSYVSATDTQGNAYTATGAAVGTNNKQITYCSLLATGLTSGVDAVTVTAGSTTITTLLQKIPAATGYDPRAVANGGKSDQYGPQNSGSSNTPSITTTTLTQDNELVTVLTRWASSPGTYTEDTEFATINTNSATVKLSCSKITSGTGGTVNFNPQWTTSGPIAVFHYETFYTGVAGAASPRRGFLLGVVGN